MEKNEVEAAAAAQRRLDFTPAILPDHPQARLQSKLLALAQPQSVSPKPQFVYVQSSRELAPPLPVPWTVLTQPRPTMPLMKDSPMPRQRSKIEVKIDTPNKQKQCNCKSSRCLKLYCECYASGSYCDGCNCTNCFNDVRHDSIRQKAVGTTLERNQNAFRPKVASRPLKVPGCRF